MHGFKEYFNEAIAIARNCDHFGPNSQTKGWWFAGAGSELGCHKKFKPKTLKMKFKEGLSGNPGTETGYWQTGLNKGAGGYVGKPQEPAPKIDNKKKNDGCAGSAGPCMPANPDGNKTKNSGCGGGPASGPCITNKPGCSGYMCPSKSSASAPSIPS